MVKPFFVYISRMKLQSELHKAPLFQNLELLANQVVEGFISGIHKSPFHGFQQNLRSIRFTIQEKAPNI